MVSFHIVFYTIILSRAENKKNNNKIVNIKKTISVQTDDYIGLTCPFCQSVLKPGQDVVKCTQCETYHHTECWQEYGACSMCGCKRSFGITDKKVKPAQKQMEISEQYIRDYMW